MTTTLLLDPTKWDLVLDAYGNIATVSNGYAIAQNAANALMTFLGEVYYDTGVGVPYLQNILGKPASLPAAKAQMQQAALSVKGVVAAAVHLTAVTDRSLSGTVFVTDETGQVSSAVFSV
jgi:hypothetical protein